MKVLIVGSGGREHTIAWACSKNDLVSKIYVSRGNGGTDNYNHSNKISNCPHGSIDDLISFCIDERIDYTIVGQEVFLELGIADKFSEHGLKILAPFKSAARLESSKLFSKRFMRKYGIKTANFNSFETYESSVEYVNSLQKYPIVIKIDGLAAGKGVFIGATKEEAELHLYRIYKENIFPNSNSVVIIEDLIVGVESTLIIITDGNSYKLMASSQDYKKLKESNKGKNTGGMGCISPSKSLNSELEARIISELVEPTLAGIKEEGIQYSGFLYFGIVITDDGEIYLLEYNCRLGDPETQTILPRLESDFMDLVIATIDGKLDKFDIKWSNKSATTLVLACLGYPDIYQVDKEIYGPIIHTNVKDSSIPLIHDLDLNHGNECYIFHSGTRVSDNGSFRTTSGRVLCITTLADSLDSARDMAYTMAKNIEFDGMTYRKDIGSIHNTDGSDPKIV